MTAIIAAIFMQAAASGTDSAGNTLEWLEAPRALKIYGCITSDLPSLDIVLICRTAAGDRLTDCAPAPDTPPPAAPKAVARFAACTSKAYRVRATGADGKPVVGTTVHIPIHLRAPR